MDELDERLRELALEAQKQMGTARGRVLLMSLWQEIYRSGRLYRPSKGKISGNYQDIYDEALHQLMEYTLRHIDRYDPERGSVMAWVNMLLDRRFLKDAIIRVTKEQDKYILIRSTAESGESEEAKGFDIDNISSGQDVSSVSDLVKQCLEEDEGNLFKNEIMREYPHINFQKVALRYVVDGYSFKEIADNFSVPYTALVSFYQRRLEKFAEIIKNYCQQ